MGFKKSVVFALFLLLILASVSHVLAITGSIGNARMILRVTQGDKIDKSILVKNVNDVAVNIELNALGDLAEDITIKDKQFTLQPGEEKKAYFTVYVRKAGTSEAKINVKFSPIDGGNGVGLSSTVIVIAEEKSGFFDWFKNNGNEDVEEDPETNEELNESQVSFGSSAKKSSNNKEPNINSLLVLGLVTIVLFVALLVLLAAAKKRIKNKHAIKYKPVRKIK